MAKRGFFAEIQHQNQLAAKRQAQAQREQGRAHAAAVRNAERAQRDAERAAAQMARASAAEQKAAEKEAKRLHEEAQLAKVDSLNAELAQVIDELDSVLAATLDVDDFVDLERFRVVVKHPPFPRKDLEVVTAMPEMLVAPVEPVYSEPTAPTGLGSVFGGKKKHEAAIAEARAAHEEAAARWRDDCEQIPERRRVQLEQRGSAEERRLRDLKAARDSYEAECKRNEIEAAAANQRLDALIGGLRSGEPSAIREYIGIVLGNSVYPERLCVEHEFDFNAELNELELTVILAPPSCLPAEKGYRYVKARDEIVATDATKKALKDLYGGVVFQTAVRTLHEVFEADRAAKIGTIALVVATEGNDPATGQHKRIEMVAVGVDRDSFLQFDLSNIVPEATLQHLGASVSKSPFDLVGIDGAPGVRGR